MTFVRIKSEYLVSVITGLVVLIIYHPVIFNLNQVYFGNSGDGLKNYFTILYHIAHYNDFWHFEGLNYPYGEHLIYTDAQPILAAILIVIVKIFPITSDYILGIVNSIMMLSLVTASLFLYKILRLYGTGKWYGIGFSILITLFSPQLDRFTGHYALSYVCVFPVLWYFLIRFNQTSKLKYSILITVLVFALGLIHLYYMVIYGAYVLCFIIVVILNNRNGLKIQRFSLLITQFLLPLIAIGIVIHLTDNITDRPYSELDFLYFRAYLSSIFLPVYSALYYWIDEHIITMARYNFEAISYVGILTTSVIGFWCIKMIGNRLKPKLNLPFSNYFWAAVLLLIFSLGIPFVWGLQWLVDYLGLLQQFRSIGRFAWPFYYVANVTVAAWVYNFIQQQESRKSVLAIYMVIAIFMVEVISKNYSLSNKISNIRSSSLCDTDAQDFSNEYRAILPLPYFHVGSEWISKTSSNEVLQNSFELSICSGRPIFSNMLSRTSSKQTIEFLKMIHGEFIVNDSTESRNFMILTSENSIPQFNTIEKNLFRNSRLVVQQNDIQLRVPDHEYLGSDQNNIIADTLLYEANDVDIKSGHSIKIESAAQPGILAVYVYDDLPYTKYDQVYYAITIEQNRDKSEYRIHPGKDLYDTESNTIVFRSEIPVTIGEIKLTLNLRPESKDGSTEVRKLEVYRVNQNF